MSKEYMCFHSFLVEKCSEWEVLLLDWLLPKLGGHWLPNDIVVEKIVNERLHFIIIVHEKCDEKILL